MKKIYLNNLEEIKTDYTLEEIQEHVKSYYSIDIEDLEDLDRLDLFDSVEDDILDDFHDGQWTAGGKKMYDNNINPYRLMEWLEEQREELGEAFYDNMTPTSIVSVVDSYNTARRHAHS